MNRFVPDEAGHFWYCPLGGHPTVLKVIKFGDREPWTSIDGHGCKVAELPGEWFPKILKPPVVWVIGEG